MEPIPWRQCCFYRLRWQSRVEVFHQPASDDMAVAVLLSLTVCRYSLRRPSGDSRRLAQKFQLLRRTLLREPVTIAHPGPPASPARGNKSSFSFPTGLSPVERWTSRRWVVIDFSPKIFGARRPGDYLTTHPGLICQVFLTPPTWELLEISVTPHSMAALPA